MSATRRWSPPAAGSTVESVPTGSGNGAAYDEHADAETLTRLAVRVDTPPPLLERLAVCVVPAARAAVASRADTPPETLTWLESDPSPLVHAALLANPACPPQLIERCAEHPDPLVRCHAAGGSGSGLLERLSVDASPVVRRCVVSNPACPAALVERAAADSDPVVRSAAAAGSEDRRLLVRLCGDPDAAVRDVAALALMDAVWDSATACAAGLGRYLRGCARQFWTGDDGRLRSPTRRSRQPAAGCRHDTAAR